MAVKNIITIPKTGKLIKKNVITVFTQKQFMNLK